MKCYVHQDRDAVGQCMTCNKAICQECAVSLQGLLHCKECLAEGRVARQKPKPKKKQRPVAVPKQKKEPAVATPRGTPSKSFFQIGALGGILDTILISLFMIELLPNISYYYDYGSSALMLEAIGPGIGIILQSVGMFGFYRNYGSSLGVVSAIFGILTGTMFISMLFISYMVNVSFYLLFLITSILVFVTGIVWGIGFISVREFTGSESLTLVAGTLFFLGGFYSVISNILAAVVFYQSAVPEVTT